MPYRKTKEPETDRPLAPVTWMQRLNRVFAIDIASCPKCGGKLRLIACIEDPGVLPPSSNSIPHLLSPRFTRSDWRMPSMIRLNFSELSIAILADRQVSRGYYSYAHRVNRLRVYHLKPTQTQSHSRMTPKFP